MAYTGGPLNRLNGKYGISAPQNSVPVMKLIRRHNPQTPFELTQLIRSHQRNECECGIKSKGSIEDFGRNLYEAQIKEYGSYRYSLEECMEWEYNLFIINSLIGDKMEKKAIEALNENIDGIDIFFSSDKEDDEMKVDLVLKRDGQTLCGIQVKPESFRKIRKSVINYNKKANRIFEKPVHYLYYNDNLEFTNLRDVVDSIIALSQS